MQRCTAVRLLYNYPPASLSHQIDQIGKRVLLLRLLRLLLRLARR